VTREIGLTRGAELQVFNATTVGEHTTIQYNTIRLARHTSRPIQLTAHILSMSSTPLQQLWDASASQPFAPTISKDQQFTVGFVLLFAALVLTGLFGMSMFRSLQ
jgi:hypothetical protein